MVVEPDGWPVSEPAPKTVRAAWLDPRNDKALLTEDWWCIVDGVPYCVPSGYYTDWASIPRAVRWLYPPDTQAWRRAALYHDYCYSHLWPLVSKKHADKAFLALLKLDGVPWWRRRIFYTAVRIGGRGGWHRVKDRDAHPHWATIRDKMLIA